MASKVGVDDFFEDGTMTFGEHIEELRVHLLRALYGILAAMLITTVFAHKVVEVLTFPLAGKLEAWHKRRLATLTESYVGAQKNLSDSDRTKVELHLQFDREELAKLLAGVPNFQPPAEGVAIDAKVDAYPLVASLAVPMAEVNQPWSIKTLSAQEPFVMYFKAALGAAVVLSCPWVFYQIYSFVAVGLYAHERRLVRQTLPYTILLFLTGVSFCYFIMLPIMLTFLLGANDWMGLQPDIRLNEWVGFCVILMIVFGLAFQLPLAMVLLERVGIISRSMLADKRRHAIMAILIFSAIATPTPDPLSQTILAVPLYLLFEAGLFLMRRPNQLKTVQSNEAPLERMVDDLFAEAAK